MEQLQYIYQNDHHETTNMCGQDPVCVLHRIAEALSQSLLPCVLHMPYRHRVLHQRAPAVLAVWSFSGVFVRCLRRREVVVYCFVL